MSVIPPKLDEFLEATAHGVLGTSRRDGRPRQSVVYFVREGDRLLISTEAGRYKALDVERTGWASICVAGPERPHPSVTLAGPARIRRDGIGEATAKVMQRITRSGEPPEAQSDEALAQVGRVILEIEVESVTGISYID